jgi:hypothetical protein
LTGTTTLSAHDMIRSDTSRLRLVPLLGRPSAGLCLAAGLICLVAAHAPAQAPTKITIAVTNHASVSWIWHTQFIFTATSAGNGTLGGSSNGWYDEGAAVQVTAAPAPHFHFAGWTGTISCASNPFPFAMDQPCFLGARFAENLATNGTPEWWLAQYGWTNDFGAAETNDPDGDGSLTWQEYIAGTDPTSPASVLAIANFAGLAASNAVICWPSVSNRIYGVFRSTNLVLRRFAPISTNIPAFPPMNVHTVALPGTGAAFYTIRIEKK